MRSTLHYIGLHPTTTKKMEAGAGIYSGYSTLKQEENSALKSFMFPLQIMSDWLISQLKGLNTWQYFWGENFEHLTTTMVKIGQMYLAKILFYNFGFN